MHSARARIAGVATVLAAGIALSGCSAIGGILQEVTGTDPFNDSNPFSIEVGDCFSEPQFGADDTVSEISFVDCGLEHDDEAYASVLLSDLAFPGDDAVLAKADDACYDRFFDYVGAPPDYDGSLNYGYLYPTQESWDGGDREILCYVYDSAGTTVGSLRGTVS